LWRVQVDADQCVGSGLCVGIAPAHFDLVDGRSRPPAAPVDAEDGLLDAAECCPMEAIAITDASTGEPVYGPPADHDGAHS
jgi:ferredoxin